MKLNLISRREMIEICIVRGVLVAGVVGLSQTNLFARWLQGEREAKAPTRPEIVNP